MHSARGAVILLGIVFAFAAQAYGAVRTFRSSILDSVLCLLVPGWVLFVAKRDAHYSQVSTVWVAGIACIAMGTFVLT